MLPTLKTLLMPLSSELAPCVAPAEAPAACPDDPAPSPIDSIPPVTVAWMIGRRTIVLNILTTVSRKFVARSLPPSNPRSSASVSDCSIVDDVFFQSSSAFLAASALA